jgi:hypothetical protein
MSKNKDKKGAQAAAQSTKKDNTVKGRTVNNEVKEQVKNTAAEQRAPEKPIEDASGNITATEVQEEVQAPAPTVHNPAEVSAAVFKNAELQEVLTAITLTPETTLDANHTVELLTVATKRFETKDPRNPTIIAANEMLDELTCYCIALAGVNMLSHGKKIGLSVPIGALPTYVRAMGYFGIALPEASAVPDPKNPGQMVIPFEGVSKETEKTIKEEIKLHKNAKPEMDVSLWKSEDDVKKAISYILSDTLSKDNRFQVSLSKVRMYKVLNAANEEEKKMWESSSLSAIFETMLTLLGGSKSTLLNAVGGQVYSAAATRKNPILSHLTLKRNFPQCTDKDISEIVQTIVKTKALSMNPDQPVEQNIAWMGLKSGKREDCLLIPTKSTNEDKEIMGRLQSAYSDKIGVPSEEGYNLKATNFLATIINLYKADDFISQYSAADYTDCVNKALEAISGKTAPKDDKALDPKEAKKE